MIEKWKFDEIRKAIKALRVKDKPGTLKLVLTNTFEIKESAIELQPLQLIIEMRRLLKEDTARMYIAVESILNAPSRSAWKERLKTLANNTEK